MLKESLLVLLLTTSTFTFGQLKVGEKAIDFSLTGYDGKNVTLQSSQAEVTILNFWASWCGPCIKSLKSTIKPLYNSYDRSLVDVIGISNDQKESPWRKAIEKFEIPWPNVWDEDKALVRGYQVPAIPTYFLMNKEGEIIASNVYASQLKSEVKKALKKLGK